MIYIDMIEHNIVGDAKNYLIAMYSIHLQNKSGDLISTGQYINYQSFTSLQYKKTIEKSFS